MSEYEKILLFLNANGFIPNLAAGNNEYTSFDALGGGVSIEVPVPDRGQTQVVLVNSSGPFQYLAIDYFAVVGALVCYRLVTIGFMHVADRPQVFNEKLLGQ